MAANKIFRTIFRPIGLVIIALIFLVPYLWLIGSAFKPRDEIFRYIYPFSWKTFVPLKPTLDNFIVLFTERGFGASIALSLGIAVVTVALTLLICSMMAFVLARLEFPGRSIVFALILATLLVPFEARMVPLFLIVQDLGMDNTLPAVFLPWVADAFIIFLLRQHFQEIPNDLYDAAVVDGASHFRVYWTLMLPNIKPALVSAALIKFIWSWDSYIWPLIVLRDPDMTVITVAIAKLFGDQGILWELVFASAFITTVPVLIIFLFLQRYYIAGVTSTGIKG